MKNAPLLSLICVYNDQDQYDELVRSTGSLQIDIEFVGLDNRSSCWSSAASAYLEGASRASSSVLVFSHQDIRFIDDSFLLELVSELTKDPMQIIGVAGAIPVDNGHGRKMLSGMYQGSKLMRHHTAFEKTAVMSLDECLFALGSEVLEEVTFDGKTCDSWHFYAVDMCLQARLKSISSYVIPANVLHLSGGNRDASYYLAQEKIKNKYKEDYDYIVTTCGWTSTSYIDPYRPIVDDEIMALTSNHIGGLVRFYLPVIESMRLSNTRFFPSVESLSAVNSIEGKDEDASFFAALYKMSVEDRRLLEFVTGFNNFVASQNWLYDDLLDLKRDFVESTKAELMSSARFRVGHLLVPWSCPKYGSLPVASAMSASGPISFVDDAIDYSSVLSNGTDDIISALSRYAKAYDRSSLGAVGQKSLDVLSIWQDEKDELDKLRNKKMALEAIDCEAAEVKRAIEATLAFRLGSGLSRLVGR